MGDASDRGAVRTTVGKHGAEEGRSGGRPGAQYRSGRCGCARGLDTAKVERSHRACRQNQAGEDTATWA